MSAFAPLHGVTVLDLTSVLAGPFAGYQLACLGARVIKVESLEGDLARRLGADPEYSRERMGISFLAVNAGKESIALDLQSPLGRSVLLDLVDRADVLIENFRPGVMARLGLGYDVVKARRPRIVYCSVSGFGQTGPLAARPAYDQIIQGIAGVMSVTGDPRSAPLRIGYPACDTIGGLTAAFAICAQLVDARARGEGAYLDVSMLDATIGTMGWVVSNYLNAGLDPKPMGNDNFNAAPSGTFRTAAGLINIAANEQKQFEALADIVGAPDWKHDPRFAEREARKQHRAEMNAALETMLTSRSAEEWERLLIGAGVPAGRVLSVPAMLEHAHVVEGELIASFDDVAGAPRPVKVARSGFRVEGTRPGPAVPPPTLSQHRDTLLEELGYDAARREALIASGAVG